MKKHKKHSAKILSLALAAVMVVTMIPTAVLANETKGDPTCHPVHDGTCGYIKAVEGTPCAHLNEDGTYICTPADADEEYVCPHDDECGFAEAVEGAPCIHECELCKQAESTPTAEPTPAPECSCTVKCTASNEENGIEAAINTECLICGAENAGLAGCKGEEPTLLSAERTTAKRGTFLDLQHSGYILDKDGNQITPSAGVFDMTDSEGWKFDSNTQTLTLNGANFETNGNPSIIMPRKEGVKIVLVGESFISNSDNVAIDVANETLTIEGDGTLTANTAQVCIAADSGIVINGGTLNLTSSNSNALYGYNNDILIGGGTLNLNTVASDSISTNGNITVSGGTVDATSSGGNAIFTTGELNIGGSANVTTKGYYCGLHAQKDGINISGGNVKATSTDDAAVFTDGDLNISGNADVSAIGGVYAGLQAAGNITIGDSKVEAISFDDSAIYTPTSLLINGNADVRADGRLRGLQSEDVQIAGNAKVYALSDTDNAITGKTNLSITENAEVEATGYSCGILAEQALVLSGKNVTAKGETNDAIFSWNNDIFINGAVTATSDKGYGVRSMYGTITADTKADINATGTWAGIHAESGDVTFTGSKIEAVGTIGDGIYSEGTISIDGGNVHAKGAYGYVAIRAKNVQTADEAAASKIMLTDMVEKNGGKVAFCDWYTYSGRQTSWTTFIAKDDNALISNGTGGIDNGLGEVWLASPNTVTFDNQGTTTAVTVYPNNTVTAPNDPTKDGSHFVEWQLDNTKFDFTTPITADITLTAKFAVHTPNADDGDCTTAITCSVCGEITTAAKTHVWDTAWTNNSGDHWHKCKNTGCTQMDSKAVHTFDEWVVDKAATETETGRKHRDCSVCAYTESVEIPVLPHTHKPVAEWSKDANNHWHNCTANDGERMNEAAHTWNGGEITTPATITQEGTKTYTCTVCSQTKTETIPKLPSSNTIVDDSTGTKVEYENGAPFDSSIVLSVTSKPQAEMDKFKDSVNKVAPGLTLGGLYDVKLLKDGVAIQPDGKIKISIPLTDAMKAMTNLQIVYIDDNGNITVIPSEVKDGMIVFVTDHFSYYGVIGKVKATDPGNNNGGNNGTNNENSNGNSNNGNSPQTGDSSSILLFVLLMGTSGIALVILGKKRKVWGHLNK